MEKLSKQFAELATKWKANQKADAFLIARLKLTFYYTLTAVVILVSLSILLYKTILSHFAMSVLQIGLRPDITQAILRNAQDILIERFVTIDSIIMLLVVVLGFLLTDRTLAPIGENMQKQKRFIADASHELRTPIAVIISGLEVALNNKKLDSSLAQKTLENTLDEMREFSQLSNNLLDISKYDMAQFTKFEPLDVSGIVLEIIEKNKNLAKLKEINIETKIESPGTIRGNKIELSRVFYNVLDNAIKYTPSGGRILIEAKVINHKYILSIKDTGIGITKDIFDKIFDPFFRGDASRNTTGAGLGLTLSKKIIENHKGTISLKSEVNKGTKVIISFPIISS